MYHNSTFFCKDESKDQTVGTIFVLHNLQCSEEKKISPLNAGLCSTHGVEENMPVGCQCSGTIVVLC